MANTPLPTNLDVDIWASGALAPDFKVDPQSIKYAQGWVVELARVDYENFIQNRQDEAIANIVENGVPHWEPTITYQRQSTVRSPINKFVYCAINNGVMGGSDPSSSGDWVKQDEFTSDSITQNIQTFADSSLKNINFDTLTKVLNKDGSNLDTGSGASLVANRDLSNVTAENLDTKLSSSGAASLSVVAQKVNIDVPVVRSVAKDYISSASDTNNLLLTAVANEQTPTNYFDEMSISFRYPNSFAENTSSVFINLNNLGPIELTDLLGNSLTLGALRADDHILAIYELSSSKFLITSNRSEQAGVYGEFIAHNISVNNSLSNTTAVQAVTLTGTPLAHCKSLAVKITTNNNGSDNLLPLEGGTRIVLTPSNITSFLSSDQLGTQAHINQIMVTGDDLELFATVPAYSLGTITVTSEIIGGYR